MEKMVFAGIDEAGRGSVIGPLVIAGVSLDKKDEAKLKKLGLKDSKLLGPLQREAFAKKIEELAKDIVVVKLSACRIDNLRGVGRNLNRIEADKFGDILNMLGPDTAFIDCPDVNTGRMALHLKKLAGERDLVVEHKADSRYPIVSAASIIAKVERDREVRELHKEWGDFGPGYPSHDKTISWLKDWIGKNKEYPDIVRKSWLTAQGIKNEKNQRRVFGFFRRKGEECKGKNKAT